ncbi:16S ribosomal RNA methyltransferase [Arthrobacter sp. PAMC 25486]|uniref:16S rRNA (uracil(1498)-N(3))-methyltransferase n=1 Tax=Arthrobacter sp. PAMC 25486 TaxID=1494608 RepID=UPI0005363D2C|nr:16S rRNA (uracil(1498)-N(3))-methyltransferase [Arthrobacter sp. PAMC 25486]AIY00499.1 16S ribosomal RNA methyltransferase [Arthrobacter sp. PAMC 25486]
MSNPVFYAGSAALAGLVPGAVFTLDGAEGRHATTVKRLAAGEPVDVCDGGGLRLVCTVSHAEKGSLTVAVQTVLQEPAPAITFTLIQALAKGDRDELAIETATELGIDAVLPWQAERSIVRWKLDKTVKGPEKWRQVVTAAAKQARRATVPTVGALVGTAGVCEQIAAAGLALILHEDATDPVAEVARHWQDSRAADAAPGTVLLIVGPEGGMSAAEVAAFTAAGAKTALLGHHVLRSSTAGPAAVVLLSQQLGRW